MKTYYITGISGFLGNAILKELAHKNDIKIVGMVMPNDPYIEKLKANHVEVIIGNILSKDDINLFLSTNGEGEKILIHVAGKISTLKRGDKLTTKINYEGTKNLVDIAINNKIDKFIYVSSVDALDFRKDREVIVEQDYYHEDKCKGVYGKSKALASNYVIDASKKGLHTVVVNPSALFGPDDPFNSPINNAIHRYLDDKMPVYVKGGYDVVDVRDVAKGIVNASKYGKNGESYLLTGHYISVRRLFNLTAKISGGNIVKHHIPHFVIKMISPFVTLLAKIKKKNPLFTGFSMDCLYQNANYSSKKAEECLGYKKRDIEVSLIDIIRDYKY